ncbi:hypothetical protein D8B26_008401 [Coccidioides posadasii str. Silveira]|uniref:uncharacterized protein n=1 Tax=Coccidioides posadasii (strain RMSCC 757 / Silveira) TaxID=443226 RepID=UPI001BF12B06|nr:hypothetical protein D8B26_008401 [Coccidioides posadasii str. Silveira]
MESAATDEKPKQIASFSAPPPPPPPQPPPPSQQQNQHPQQPPPLQQPQQQQQQPPGPSRPLPPPEHSHTLPPPRSQFEPWSRPYPPFEGANADQRGHPAFNGPPREGSHHPQDITHSDPSFRPINGNSHEPSSSSLPPTPTTEYRPSFPYGPPSDGHGNAEPPRGLQMMPPPPPTPDGIPIHRPYGSGAHMPPGAAAYDAGYYFAQANVPYSQRQRRTTRAQQVQLAINVEREKPSVTKVGLPVGIIDDRFDKFENIEKIDEVVKLLKAHTDKLDALLGRANRTKPSSSISDPELKQPVQNAATPQQGKGAEMEPVKLSESWLATLSSRSKGTSKLRLTTTNSPSRSSTQPQRTNCFCGHQYRSLFPTGSMTTMLCDWRSRAVPFDPMVAAREAAAFAPVYIPSAPSSARRVHAMKICFSFAARGGEQALRYSKGTVCPRFLRSARSEDSTVPAHSISMWMVYAYHKSYMENMHILHPFLRSTDLAIMVKDFVNAYSPPKRGHFAAPPFGHIVANDSMNTLNRSQKRKRSVDVASGYTELESPGSDHSMGASCPPIQRSMDNAIVLLVLALGAICSWKTELPGPIPDPPSKLPYVTSAVSPVTMDSAMPSTNAFRSPTSRSPNNIQGWKRSGSYSGSDHSDPNLKNMDVIPGMAYYALASDILGNLQGGNDLAHAQGCLLAALYTGQLAHPFASHGWISQAARACQVLVRARSFEVMPDGPRKDLITFAFWTCLQLESDILAELDLPASGISRLEGRMEFPKAVFAHSIPNEIEAPDTLMMMYYSAQIHLRKVLNRVHTNLYKTEKTANGEKRTRWTTTIQEALSDMLEYWRSGLPKAMQWDDSDPPARDINIARMRGKYYGARYIIHRPLLHHALHPMIAKTHSTGPAESPAPSVVSSANSQISPALAHVQQVENIDRWSGEMPPPPRITSSQDPPQPPFEKDLDPKLHAACVACIEAAMHSTVAFDNVEGRPIVTNIFGTAHAQFGNILVLAATYTSRLSNLSIERDSANSSIGQSNFFFIADTYLPVSGKTQRSSLRSARSSSNNTASTTPAFHLVTDEL